MEAARLLCRCDLRCLSLVIDLHSASPSGGSLSIAETVLPNSRPISDEALPGTPSYRKNWTRDYHAAGDGADLGTCVFRSRCPFWHRTFQWTDAKQKD